MNLLDRMCRDKASGKTMFDNLLSKEYLLANSVEKSIGVVAIYFLLKDHEIVYVGQSTSVYNRILSHINSDKDWNRYHIQECSKEELNELERLYIYKFKPFYNKVMNPDCTIKKAPRFPDKKPYFAPPVENVVEFFEAIPEYIEPETGKTLPVALLSTLPGKLPINGFVKKDGFIMLMYQKNKYTCNVPTGSKVLVRTGQDKYVLAEADFSKKWGSLTFRTPVKDVSLSM